MEHFEVIIIGAGAMGSATAYELAKSDVKTLLLEQFKFLHSNGSSHGDSRIIRKTYAQKHFSDMMNRSYELWEIAQNDSQMSVMKSSGGLDFGKIGNENLEKTIEICRISNVEFEELNAVQLRTKYPMLKIPDDFKGIYQKDAGILNATESVAMFQILAKKYGATLIDNMKVISINEANNQVQILTKGREFTADKVIITAGSWINKILTQFSLEVDVKIWNLSIGYYQTSKIQEYSKFPIFICWEEDETYYGFPINEKPDALKIGPHFTLDVVQDIDNRNKNPDQELLGKVSSFIERRFNGIKLEPNEIDVCLYTMTDTEDFIIDFLPEKNNILIAAGFSGHGFKFTPLIGEILAKLISGEESPFDLSHFQINNFLIPKNS